MSTLHVLLPDLPHAGADASMLRWLARGDRLPDVAGGRARQLHAWFRFADAAMPAAALRHSCHAGDAAVGAWLCADPAWIRSEATGARLLACPLPDLGADEAEALAATLRPLFGDAGVPLAIDAPGEWCLHLVHGAPPVRFVDPADALGASLIDCLPEGEAARLWRRLFNEAQVALHGHPVNAARVAAGKHPVNALWFWGAGALPGSVESSLGSVASADDVVRGLAKLAGALRVEPTVEALEAVPGGDALLDLDLPGRADLASVWLAPFQRWLRQHRYRAIDLIFADGTSVRVRHAHRLRFWRRG